MENLQTINKCFIQCFEKSSTFEQAQITSDIDRVVSELITKTIPQEISFYLNDSNYLVNGSVGKGRATKTPWNL